MLPRDAGFYVIDERVYVRGWHDEVAELLTSGQVDTLVIDEWEQPGLSALVPLKRSIRRLSIQDPQVTDLSAVSELTGLSDLYVGEGSWPADAFEAIDFSRLKKLESFRISVDVPRFGNLHECPALTSIHITDSGLRDLTALSRVSRLERLEVMEAPLRSLAGIEGLGSLEWLRLYQVPIEQLDGLQHARRLKEVTLRDVRRLKSLAGLSSLAELRALEISGSRKIADLERLRDLRRLEQLRLFSVGSLGAAHFLSHLTRLKELVLVAVGELPSLDFLRGLNALERFDASDATAVRDGDMSVLLELPALTEVSFMDRRHYSPRLQEIKAVLAERVASATASRKRRAKPA